jgi:hypothetical protein
MHKFELRPDRQHSRWPIRRWVCMGDAPPHGTTIAYLHIANGCRSLSQERTVLLQQCRGFHRVVRRAGANDERAVVLPYATEFL